jgi:hypothetical protein
MKRLLLLFYFTCCILHFSYAQNPLVKQWDNRFGGSDYELLSSFQQTSDGGYILGGYSNSGISGDKTQSSWGSYDYWIVKTDSLGNKQWDKRFGGTSDDEFFSLQQTTDGGYILGGYSVSGIGGDKTQYAWGGGSEDYWIIKIDSLGTKQWDKRYGGTDNDILYSLQQTSDGGYILGGASLSDSSGNKTQPSWGDWDYWIVKINSLGVKQWDKRFGGTNDDNFLCLRQTSDGGYILGGYSGSGISGDKTQASWGLWDYWIVKTDSLGTKQWDKRLGGIYHDVLTTLQETNDRGYILGGYSGSIISGDKTQDTWGSWDYWIVKIDSLGVKQWDKDFGGTHYEEAFGSVSQTMDGGYLLAGTSYSHISGNKTQNNLGQEQVWVVKTDSLGSKQWDKTIFTLGHDEAGYAIQTKDGCYAIVNYTSAGIGGYKTQPSWGYYDYWIIKFCDTTLTTNTSTFNIQHSIFNISPNPFTDELTITFQKQNIKQATFTVKNILGQTVFSLATPNSLLPTKLDLSFLTKGIYFLEATIDGERTVKKIVKQ